MINYTEVKDIIKRKLIGIHMTNIGRAADMLWIQYGNFITAKNYKGEEVRKANMQFMSRVLGVLCKTKIFCYRVMIY